MTELTPQVLYENYNPKGNWDRLPKRHKIQWEGLMEFIADSKAEEPDLGQHPLLAAPPSLTLDASASERAFMVVDENLMVALDHIESIRMELNSKSTSDRNSIVVEARHNKINLRVMLPVVAGLVFTQEVQRLATKMLYEKLCDKLNENKTFSVVEAQEAVTEEIKEQVAANDQAKREGKIRPPA